MEGPWYTLEDACERLQATRSELAHLVQTDQIKAVAYVLNQSFLLYSRKAADNWLGHATCLYSGHITLHKHCIESLLSNEPTEVGKGSCILLEESGIRSWRSAYPFRKPPPHPPLLAWQGVERNAYPLQDFSTTPTPDESETLKDMLADFATSLQKIHDRSQEPTPSTPKNTPLLSDNALARAAIARTDTSRLKLFFPNKVFQPSALRFPHSEIQHLIRGSSTAAEASPAPNNKQPIMTPNPTRERENQLHSLIQRILVDNPKISEKAAWAAIQADYEADEPLYDSEHILLIVDDLAIHWKSRGGAEQILKRASFTSTLSRLRRELSEQSLIIGCEPL